LPSSRRSFINKPEPINWSEIPRPPLTAVLKRTNSFRDKFERYISKDRHNAHLRRKAYTAIAAKMARTVHAVVNHGEPYRPFFEGVSPGGRTSL